MVFLAVWQGSMGGWASIVRVLAARPSPTPTLSPQQRKVGGASLPHPFGPQTKHNFYFWNMQIYCRRKGLCADKTLNCLASFFTVYGDVL
jgi:hypothetical protein